MKKYLLFKALVAFLLAFTLPCSKAAAQIAYSENFNTSAGGWSVGPNTITFGTFFRNTSVSPCTSISGGYLMGFAGSYASSGVWQYYGSTTISPLIGSTLGGAISISFDCIRESFGNTNASITLSYGPSPTGPWTTLISTNPSTSCVQVVVPPFTTEAGPMYLKGDVNLIYTTYSQQGYGTTIYMDNIVVSEAALPVCSGTPTGGTTASSQPTVCSGPAFSLTVSPSPNQTGLTYQWEKSTDGTTWTNIAGATTKYISAINQTASTYYRRKITCAGSGLSAWSSSLLVAQATSPFACYCASGADAPQYADVTNVEVGTLSNAAPDGSLSGNQFTATGSAGKYSNWTASGVNVPDLPRAVTIPFSVGLHSYSPVTTWTKVYVDFNGDGDLEDAGEMVYSGTNGVYFGTQFSGSMTIPANAVLGNTLMRVVCSSSASTAADVSPCGDYSFGETEDYRVNIVPTTNCGGTPATPVASGPAVVCDFNQAFVLNATNIPASGVTAIGYQWQKSVPGANSWTAITGAATVPYTVAGQSSAADYRLVVTCSASGQLSYSNVVAVGMGTSSACYCASVITSASACQRWISGVTTTGAVTNMTNTSTCTPGGFADYAASVTGPAQYQDYPLNLSLTSANSRTSWSIYVDYNNDAAFTNDELVYQNSNTTGGNTVAASFLVPLNATPGTHRMRIRADSGATAATACTATVSGETEDYTLTVLPKPACTGTPAGITISTTQPYIYCGAFPAKPMTLTGGTNTGTGGVTGISTAWERSSDASFSSSGINQFGATIGQNQSAFYRAKQTCATSGQSAYSNVILVANHEPSVTISPATAAFCAGSGGVVLTANVNSGIGSSPALSYSWGAGGSPACNSCISCTSCSSVTVNPTASANFSVTVTASGNSCPGTFYAFQDVTVNPTPTVLSAIAPAVVCTGGAVTLTGVTDTPGIYNGFSGPFAPSKWNYFSQTTSNGKIITSGAPNAIVFISSDSTALSPTGGSDDWSITIPYAGNVTFNWTYSTNDSAGNDFVRYLINGGTATNLPGFSNSGPNIQSGTAVIAVPAGAFFTLRGRSRTNTGGSSTTTISNFSAPGGTASTVSWYTAPTGGTLIANGASVIPTGPGPVTYYAQAVATGTGCVSASRMATNSVTLNPAGQWTGALSTDWNTAGNWCGGIPTQTSNVVIPNASSVANMPLLSAAASANNIALQSGATLTVTGTLNLWGNITGTGMLNSTAGTVNLTGSGTQTLSSNFTTGTLMVNGGSTKMLAGNVTVNNALTFTSGMIDVGSSTLTLGAGAVVTGASATKYVRTSTVNGRLKRPVGNTPVLFPVGNASYAPATLTNAGALDNFSVGVRDSVFQNGISGLLINPIAARFVNHTWNVEEEVAGGSNATLGLQWNAGEVSNSGFDYNHVYVAHYTGGTYTYDSGYSTAGSLPAAIGYPGSGPYSATRSNITSFSPFTVMSAAAGAPLPATLLAFEAEAAGRQNKITWQTAQEESIKSYVVERSANGAQFSYLNETPSQNKPWTYTTYDSAPNADFTYYRLKMTDQNGTFAYSKTVRLSSRENGEVVLTAQPNPATDLLTVRVYGTDNGVVNLTDVSGRVLITTAVKNGIAEINVSNITAGTYFARYNNSFFSKTITVTKQ